jgi:hypothetical protein
VVELRGLIRAYETALNQCQLGSDEVKRLRKAPMRTCLGPLLEAAEKDLNLIGHYIGRPKMEFFEGTVLPQLIRIRCLDGILGAVYARQRGRRLFLHPECGIDIKSASWATKLSNRLAAPGNGRNNPTWKDKTFTPLHFHTQTYAESLIYSWQKEALYVHGFVSFHMDKDMKGKEAKEAEAIEVRGRSIEVFEEVLFLSNDELIGLADLLSGDLEWLQDLLHKLTRT